VWVRRQYADEERTATGIASVRRPSVESIHNGYAKAPMAAWDSPARGAWRPVDEPHVSIRLGDLRVVEARRRPAGQLRQLVDEDPPGKLKVHIADLASGGADPVGRCQPVTVR
jgi:hypothetical protein